VQLSNAEQLTLPENARLFALMNMAIADAAIVAFEAKYFYNFWRPVTAIRSGDLDNNPRTEREAGFTPFIATPAYPAYPSGHGSLSNAARSTLERFFGRGRHAVTLTNTALPAVTLRYTNLRHITDDIADARIYSGIHFRFDQDAAEDLGERVAAYVVRNHLVCARRGGCESDEE
jgi:PAP2 superfamily